MPRRGALRLLSTAVVGAWASGSAPGARAALSRRAHTCDTAVKTGAWKYCTQATEYCFPTCCPNERKCSVGRLSNRGCPEVTTCCDPCNPRASTPDGAGGCGPGPVAAYCPCKPGQKVCWRGGGGRPPVCCDADEYCVSSLKEEGQGNLAICCKRGRQSCPRANGFACCPQGTRCCKGGTGSRLRSSCCNPLTQICDEGACTCKPGNTLKCGRDCCDPRRQKCCGGKRCVPKDATCDDFVNA
jgi:hypothetical protein